MLHNRSITVVLLRHPECEIRDNGVPGPQRSHGCFDERRIPRSFGSQHVVTHVFADVPMGRYAGVCARTGGCGDQSHGSNTEGVESGTKNRALNRVLNYFIFFVSLIQENKSAARRLFTLTIVLVVFVLISRFHRWGEWSISDFVGFESFYTRATVSVWSSKAWRSGRDRLWDEYNADTAPLSIVFSVFGAIAGSFGWIQEHMLLDIVLMLNLAMKQHMSKLIRIIQDKNVSADRKWEEYEKAKNLSNKINDTFQYFLPLAHLNNLLLFSYFLLGAITRTGYVVSFLLGMKAVKILVTYYVASATAHKVTFIKNYPII